MCLIEVGDLGGTTLLADPRSEPVLIDLEPLRLSGEITIVTGVLIAVRLVPMCPGFRQVTVRQADGSGLDVVVALSTLLFIRCAESEIPS